MQPNAAIRKRRRSDFYEDPHQHLWAISYSDLLMVLVSFFVIYFESSTRTEATPNSTLAKIIMALKEKGGRQEGVDGKNGADKTNVVAVGKTNVGTGAGVWTGTGTGTGVGAGAAAGIGDYAKPKQSVMESISATLSARKDIQTAIDKRHPGILVHFSDNIYRAGGFAVNGSVMSILDDIMGVLYPMKEEITLVFIGHTDATPLKYTNKKIIDSNLALSNMRGSRAAEVALKRGFDPRWVTAQGVGEYARNTRSLSIRISEREKESEK